jgi:hypothetical protein
MKTEEAFGGGLERPVEEEGPERWGGEGEGWQLPGLQRHLPGEWGTLMGHVTSRRICVDLLGQPKKPNWANGSLVNSSRRCLLARIFQIQTKGIIYWDLSGWRKGRSRCRHVSQYDWRGWKERKKEWFLNHGVV